MSDDTPPQHQVGSVTKPPRPAKRPTAGTDANSIHTYRLIYVSESCTAYQVGDLVSVSVSDPPPAWTPIDLGGNCSDSVGALDEG